MKYRLAIVFIVKQLRNGKNDAFIVANFALPMRKTKPSRWLHVDYEK